MFKSNLKYFFLLALAIPFFGCGGDSMTDDDMDPNPTVDLAVERQKVAKHIGDHFILPSYENLNSEINTLKTALETIGTTTIDQTQLEELQMLLKQNWLTWQTAAIYQMGPTESKALRGAINTYPVDTDLIESNISSGNYTLGTLGNIGAEGLPAIDYLLHKENALSDLADAARMAYLTDLVNHLAENIQLVNQDWQTGSFFTNFISETSNGTDVGSAIGLLVNSIDLHFQRFLRDGKVAIPAGVRSAGVPRPTTTEPYYAGYSRELLTEALTAYLNLFKGTGVDGESGTSISAYLKTIDQETVANDIEAKFAESIEKANTLNNSLSTQIEEDVDKVIDVFFVLQELVTLFKSDMASVMGITITNLDTDGD